MTLCNPWTVAHQDPQSFTISQSLLKLKSIESVMPSNHLTLCCPLLLLPSISPSITVFSNESALRIRWPKYWSFNLSISPSNKYLRLISFGNDCFDLLAVQGILKSLLQHHNSKTSVLWCSTFFMVQLSHLYMATGKTSFDSTDLCWKSDVSALGMDNAGQGFPDSSVGKESACTAGDPGSIPGSGRSTGEGIGYPLQYSWASLVAQLVKNPPTMRETWV